jgi:hypothetical protein
MLIIICIPDPGLPGLEACMKQSCFEVQFVPYQDKAK